MLAVLCLPLGVAPPDEPAEEPDVSLRIRPSFIVAGNVTRNPFQSRTAGTRTAVRMLPRNRVSAYVFHLHLARAGRNAVRSINAVMPLAAPRTALVDCRNPAVATYELVIAPGVATRCGNDEGAIGESEPAVPRRQIRQQRPGSRESFLYAKVTAICNGRS